MRNIFFGESKPPPFTFHTHHLFVFQLRNTRRFIVRRPFCFRQFTYNIMIIYVPQNRSLFQTLSKFQTPNTLRARSILNLGFFALMPPLCALRPTFFFFFFLAIHLCFPLSHSLQFNHLPLPSASRHVSVYQPLRI